MTLTELVQKFEKQIIDNSPSILTALGAVGTVTTAYFSGKASFRAAELIANEREDRDLHEIRRPPLDLREKVRLVWHLYIPAVGTGVMSVACIIAANRIGTKRAAALAAAYSISERAFTEYKEKVVERLGQQKEQTLRDDIAQDRINRNPPNESSIIITGSGEVLCFEQFTGRYFHANMESLKKAQNDVNHSILTSGSSASLTDFYNAAGLPATSYSDEVGWNLDNLLDLKFSTVLTDDGKPCLAIDYKHIPIRDYWTLG